MPHNASQAMQDCYPLAEGGLRPFADDGAITTSGLDMSAGNQIIGIGAHIGIPNRAGAGSSMDRYLAKYDQSDGLVRLYRMDESNAAVVWTQLTSVSFTAAVQDSWMQAHFVPYIDGSGQRWMLFGLLYGGITGAAGPGLYKIKYVPGAGPPAGDGVVSQIMPGRPTGLIVNQGRWMWSLEETSILYYSEVGSVDATANILDITPSGPGAWITALAGQEPSDILIGKSGAPWVVISGDISSANTVVRELSGAQPAGPRTVRPQPVPGGGVAFIANNGSVYTTDGRNFTDIGQNIRWPVFTRLQAEAAGVGVVGMPGYMGGFIFSANSLVYDTVTKAWFSILPNAADPLDLWVPDHTRGRIWGASTAEAADATMSEYQVVGDGVFRSPQCMWQSAPFVPKSGEDARLREVELFVLTGSASVNRFTVTRFDQNGGGSVIRGPVSIGANQHSKVSFSFPNTGSPYQYIKIDWDTNLTQTEASTIERMRIGFAPGRGLG
jgi:hypothetical protein